MNGWVFIIYEECEQLHNYGCHESPALAAEPHDATLAESLNLKPAWQHGLC